MTKQQIEKIVALFPDVLYMMGDDIYFCDEVILKTPSRLVQQNLNSFCIMPKGVNHHIMIIVLDMDLKSIDSGVLKINPDVYYNNLLSIKTQVSLFKLNIDISYMPSDSRKLIYFDRIGILRKYTLNNIIND